MLLWGERYELGRALVDIDDFRSLNARRGPAAGDAALLAVAQRLKALTRASDVIGRTGADALAVLTPATPGSAGAEVLRTSRAFRNIFHRRPQGVCDLSDRMRR